MTIHVINKINSSLRVFFRQNRFLNFPLRRLLCNAITLPFFYHVCNVWYQNINKKLKMHLQAAQNKCIRFCLKLCDRSSIKPEDFEKINWLPIHERVSKCSLCTIYKILTENCLNYFEQRYIPLETNGVRTRSSYQNLNVPHRKKNVGQKLLYYVSPSLENKLEKTLKISTSLNAFKYNIKHNLLMN